MKKTAISVLLGFPILASASGLFTEQVPVLQILAIFLVLAGFIIGLGAVTVIDLHGFLARKSSYWTEATIRTHKITKPLIWLGLGLLLVGGFILYLPLGWTGLAPAQTLILFILILNGLFLSFYVSPRLLQQEKVGKSTELLSKKMQRKITTSFLLSFCGWWGLVLSFVWYLVILH